MVWQNQMRQSVCLWEGIQTDMAVPVESSSHLALVKLIQSSALPGEGTLRVSQLCRYGTGCGDCGCNDCCVRETAVAAAGLHYRLGFVLHGTQRISDALLRGLVLRHFLGADAAVHAVYPLSKHVS